MTKLTSPISPSGNGPSRDFIEAYEHHVGDVYGFFIYRLNSGNDAEDLTQLTFERAFRAWGRFDRQRGSFKTWVLAIARNALIDDLRRPRTRAEVPVAELHTFDSQHRSSPGPEATALGLDPDLELALCQLGAREREILALRFGADLNGPEIADLLDLTLANVQQILSRSLRRLRRLLEDEQIPPRTPPQ